MRFATSGVEVYINGWRFDADDQGITGRFVVPFQRRARLPPTRGGIDCDRAPAREVRRGSPPDVSVQRTSMACFGLQSAITGRHRSRQLSSLPPWPPS